LFSFPSKENNKKLCVLCVLSERSERAVKKPPLILIESRPHIKSRRLDFVNQPIEFSQNFLKALWFQADVKIGVFENQAGKLKWKVHWTFSPLFYLLQQP